MQSTEVGPSDSTSEHEMKYLRVINLPQQAVKECLLLQHYFEKKVNSLCKRRAYEWKKPCVLYLNLK